MLSLNEWKPNAITKRQSRQLLPGLDPFAPWIGEKSLSNASELKGARYVGSYEAADHLRRDRSSAAA